MPEGWSCSASGGFHCARLQPRPGVSFPGPALGSSLGPTPSSSGPLGVNQPFSASPVTVTVVTAGTRVSGEFSQNLPCGAGPAAGTGGLVSANEHRGWMLPRF